MPGQTADQPRNRGKFGFKRFPKGDRVQLDELKKETSISPKPLTHQEAHDTVADWCSELETHKDFERAVDLERGMIYRFRNRIQINVCLPQMYNKQMTVDDSIPQAAYIDGLRLGKQGAVLNQRKAIIEYPPNKDSVRAEVYKMLSELPTSSRA
jgi:hypothetical protein